MTRLARVGLTLTGLIAGLVSAAPYGSAAAQPAPDQSKSAASHASASPPPALCHGRRATIVGTRSADMIHGTPGDDVIVAGAGTDTVHGVGGDDVICGSLGGDELYGGPGDDELFGQKGGPVSDDEGSGYFLGNLVDGGRGDDLLSGGPQADMPFYEQGTVPDRVTFTSAGGPVTVTSNGTATGAGVGTDHIRDDFGLVNGTGFDDDLTGVGIADLSGRAGNDHLVASAPKAWLDFTGGPGNDLFDLTAARRSEAFGGRGRDRVIGSPGLDYVVPGPGKDVVDTRGGRDDVYAVSDGDLLRLGSGADLVEIGNHAGAATYVGGAGRDRLRVDTNGRTRLVVDAAHRTFVVNGRRSAIEGFEAYVVDPEYIGFPAGFFVFRGSSVAETVVARGGDYRKLVVQGAGGRDHLEVTVGRRSAKAFVYGGPGDDIITGSDASDYLNGNADVDTIDGLGGIDVCIGEHLANCER